LITAIASQTTSTPPSPNATSDDRGQRDPERHGHDGEHESRGLASRGPFCWRGGHLLLSSHARVDAGIDFPADLVEERLDHGGLIVRTEIAMGLGGGADLVRGQ